MVAICQQAGSKPATAARSFLIIGLYIIFFSADDGRVDKLLFSLSGSVHPCNRTSPQLVRQPSVTFAPGMEAAGSCVTDLRVHCPGFSSSLSAAWSGKPALSVVCNPQPWRCILWHWLTWLSVISNILACTGRLAHELSVCSKWGSSAEVGLALLVLDLESAL